MNDTAKALDDLVSALERKTRGETGRRFEDWAPSEGREPDPWPVGRVSTIARRRMMSGQFVTRGIRGLFYTVENQRCYAGHTRLFGRIVHTWSNEVGGRDNEWADDRVWTIGFAALHHVTPGKKSTNREGWSLTFASLRFARIYGGFSVSWRWADRMRTR